MRWLILIVVVLLAGCITSHSDDQFQSNPRLVDEVENDIQLPSNSGFLIEVTAEPSLLKRGETLHIRVSVTNESDGPIVKCFASGCIYGFALWNQRGELVAPPPPICTLNAPTVRYLPDEVVTREFRWVWDDPSIRPGTYLLIAGFGRRGQNESAPPVKIRLE
jgi:hypothetical protein